MQLHSNPDFIAILPMRMEKRAKLGQNGCFSFVAKCAAPALLARPTLSKSQQ